MEVEIAEGEGAILEVNWASHCNQWGLCSKLHESIEMLFGVVSGVDRRMSVLNVRWIR